MDYYLQEARGPLNIFGFCLERLPGDTWWVSAGVRVAFNFCSTTVLGESGTGLGGMGVGNMGTTPLPQNKVENSNSHTEQKIRNDTLKKTNVCVSLFMISKDYYWQLFKIFLTIRNSYSGLKPISKEIKELWWGYSFALEVFVKIVFPKSTSQLLLHEEML